MKFNNALVKVVFGDKQSGQTSFTWWRISRTTLEKLAFRLSSQPYFYYAKIYDYNRKGHKKGDVGRQVAYVYWKDGMLTYVAI